MAESYSTILLVTMAGFIPIIILTPLFHASGLDTNDTKNNQQQVTNHNSYAIVNNEVVKEQASKKFNMFHGNLSVVENV